MELDAVVVASTNLALCISKSVFPGFPPSNASPYSDDHVHCLLYISSLRTRQLRSKMWRVCVRRQN